MDFDPFLHDIVYSPSPEPEAQAASRPCPVNNKPDTPTEKPASPINKPTSPKRKRDEAIANTEAHDTTPKRPSPSRTPVNMKTSPHYPNSAHRTSTDLPSTPVTLVKGVSDFNITTPHKPKPQHAAVSKGTVNRPATIASTTALPPLVRPTLIDFTTPAKAASDVAKPSTPTAVHSSNYNSAAVGTADSLSPTSQPAITDSRTGLPAHNIGTSMAALPMPTVSSSAGTTAPATRRKVDCDLEKIPAIAPRYITTYVSPTSPVKVRDPQTFSVKPPFWRRWPRNRYLEFATHLAETFDPVPFAEHAGISAEEVSHLFHALVTEPLHDETEKMGEVAENRIQEMFRTFEAKGSKWRKWGDADGKRSVGGELAGVRPGVVQLISEKGGYIEVPLKHLTHIDQEYVKASVSGEEWAKVSRKL